LSTDLGDMGGWSFGHH